MGDYRVIKNVEWLNEQGNVRSIDMYNQYGKLYGKQTYSDGVLTLTSYFDKEMNEVILINHVTNTVQVCYLDKTYYFRTFYDFIVFYFELAKVDVSKTFYNSLNVSYFVTLFLHDSNPEVSFEHTLFWQESSEEIPDNMKQILREEEGPTKHIIVQDRDEYKRINEKIEGARVSVDYLGMLFQFKRQVNPGKTIFILTNSDNIPQLDTIVSHQ